MGILKAILKVLKRSRSNRNREVEQLYYLYGIQRIGANKKVIDELTVGRV